MSYFSRNDPSFPPVHTFSGLRSPITNSRHGQDQSYRGISLIHLATQVLQLYDVIRAVPQEAISQSIEYHRHDIAAASALEQFSRLKDCLSQSFTTSWVGKNPPNRDIYFGAPLAHSTTDLHGDALLLPTGPPTSGRWNMCMTCDSSFKESPALKKHQSLFCERTDDWVCQICQYEVFDHLTKLNQHHRSIHGEECPNCCSLRKSSISDHCKALLSQSSINAANKKAWGCPCCIMCFESFENWNKHTISHQVHNERVVNWSFSTMFRSLLCHRDLSAAFSKYDWSRCSWAYMGREECQVLRSALERHVLPSEAVNNETYSHLGMPESLVLHTFWLGIGGNAAAARLNPAMAPIATSTIQVYSNISTEHFPGVQSMTLNPRQESNIERCNDFGSEEREQRRPEIVALDECDIAETDDMSFQYRASNGTLRTWLPANNEGLEGPRQGPRNLDAYVPIPGSQTGHQKSRQIKPLLQRTGINRRMPTGRRQNAKQLGGALHEQVK